MNKYLLLLGIVAVATLGYVKRDQWLTPAPRVVYVTPTPTVVYVTPAPVATPRSPERHLAPEGTFFMVDYISTRTPRGVIGFEKGQPVKFVSANASKGTLTVTDGSYNIEVAPAQLTNDVDVAALSRQQDQASQEKLRAVLEQGRQAALAERRQYDIKSAKEIAGYRSSSTVGTRTALEQPAERKGVWEYRRSSSRYYGTPYYYLDQ